MVRAAVPGRLCKVLCKVLPVFIAVPVLISSGLFLASDAPAFQVTLSWDPPTTNVDGTPLSDLAGYKVYYGTAARAYSQSADAKNVTAYTIPGLADGVTYYFAVTAYDTAGNESDYSNEVIKGSPPAAQAASPYTLTVTKTGTGSGMVTATGISCGADCSEAYLPGTVITLSAAPGTGSLFSGWSGGCTGTGTCTVTVASNVAVTAGFNVATFNITSSAAGGGSISPAGTIQVGYGGTQTFSITPSAGYAIRDVVVDGVSAGALSTVMFTNVTAVHSVSAAFAPVSSPAPSPNIVVSPSILNFRTVRVGWTVSSSVKITNTGNSNLTVSAPGVEGTDAAMFSLRSSVPVALRPGGSSYVRVKFTPTSRGQKVAALGISSNDPDTPASSVSLSGTGL